jgi:hypothetical protein
MQNGLLSTYSCLEIDEEYKVDQLGLVKPKAFY